jgi:hypothetical protein
MYHNGRQILSQSPILFVLYTVESLSREQLRLRFSSKSYTSLIRGLTSEDKCVSLRSDSPSKSYTFSQAKKNTRQKHTSILVQILPQSPILTIDSLSNRTLPKELISIRFSSKSYTCKNDSE